MHRIDADGHVGNQFSNGDPGIGQPGTRMDADWANAVQEEIAHAIEGLGGALNKANQSQLLAALVAAGAGLLAPDGPDADAGGKRIKNLGAATEAGDAVPYAPPSWTNLTLNSAGGWSVGAGIALAYFKDSSGVVHFRGQITAGGSLSQDVVSTPNLPAGVRPPSIRYFPLVDLTAGTVGYVAVGPTYIQVQAPLPVNGHIYCFDSIQYPAEG